MFCISPFLHKTLALAHNNKKESEVIVVKEKYFKGRNPYTTLAIFTVAMAGVINITKKMKKFFVEKCDAVKQMMTVDK